MAKKVQSNYAFRKSAIILVIVCVLFFIASLFPVLITLIILSCIVSFILHPFVHFMEYRLGIRRQIVIGLVFLACLGVFIVCVYLLLTVIPEKLYALYMTFKEFPLEPALQKMTEEYLSSIPFIDPNAIVTTIQNAIATFESNLEHYISSAVSYAASFVLVPFISYFILIDGDKAMKRVIEYVPNKYFEMTLNALYKIQRDLKGYLKGWILDSLIVAVLSIIGYYTIGLDYAILLGLVAGISNLIPYVGPFVGVIPAIFLSFTQYSSFQGILGIIIITGIVQLLDNVIIQPVCFSQNVDMHPATVIIVLLIGNSLMGVLGMILAIPIYTVLKASVTETYWGFKHYRITM
ncbi:MAG TPA: AI-2E family transporter [Bacteroidota bacterium]|nr:AI-2E family transporter [Bacteroidota bacterium]